MRDMLSIKVCPLQPSYLCLSDVKVLVSQCSREHMRDMLSIKVCPQYLCLSDGRTVQCSGYGLSIYHMF